MRNLQTLLVFVLIAVLCGCTYTGAIRNDITPTAMTAQRYDGPVAVQFDPRLENYVETTKPSTMYGSAHTFQFEMGQAIKNALISSVESAYANVEVTSSRIQSKKYERIIRFDLQNANVRVEFVPGFWNPSAKADCVLRVSMEVVDGQTMETLQRLTINGTGFSTKDTSGGEDAQRQFSRAIEDAIRDLSENAANMLIAGITNVD